MSTRLRGAVVTVIGMSLTVGLVACGQTGDSGGNGSGGGGLKIGLLLPDDQVARFEMFDRPLIEKRIKELCGDCTVKYANAQGSVAAQHQQLDSMITSGVKVLILDSVDAESLRSSVQEAGNAGIPVVAYDRLVEGPISSFVSFNGDRVGKIQGESLLESMRNKRGGKQIVMLNGSPTDPNAAWFKKGALSVLKGRVKIGKSYDIAGWTPENAHRAMSSAITALGADKIDGIYAANDGLASGAIAALRAARIKPMPPIIGQDADLIAVRRILQGDQYMSVYKPFKSGANATAEMAVALGRGEKIDKIARDKISSPTTKDIPAVLLTPIALTVDNIKDTVVKDGMYTIDQICTPSLQSACEKAGLTK